jgi:hypothetical protein
VRGGLATGGGISWGITVLGQAKPWRRVHVEALKKFLIVQEITQTFGQIDWRASQRPVTSLWRCSCQVQVADTSSDPRHAQRQATGAPHPRHHPLATALHPYSWFVVWEREQERNGRVKGGDWRKWIGGEKRLTLERLVTFCRKWNTPRPEGLTALGMKYTRGNYRAWMQAITILNERIWSFYTFRLFIKRFKLILNDR